MEVTLVLKLIPYTFRHRLWVSLAVITLLTFHAAQSQNVSETGLPYIQNYSPDEYGAFIQNWGAVQDSLGIIYFANGDGILSFNGASWKLLELPGLVSPNAIVSTKKGTVFLGGIDEIGYLDSDEIGQLSYVSLLSILPEKFHDFNRIRSIYSVADDVFFSSEKYIFKWDGIKFKIWENSGDPLLFLARNTIFKRIHGEGLTAYNKGDFELVSQGAMFANIKIRAVLPYKKNSYVIATNNQLYIYDGTRFERFETNVPEFFNDNVISCGIALNPNTFAFGSFKKGVLILDDKGLKKVMLSKKGIFQSNMVINLFQDRSDLLWASLNSGIAKIEYPSPFSFYNELNNTPGLVMGFQRYYDKLYVGTGEGLYVLKNDNKSQVNLLEPLGDMGMVFETLLHRNKMLVGSRGGLFEIDKKGNSKELLDLPNVSSLCASKIDSNRVFIGTSSGLTSLYLKNGSWAIEHMFEGINIQVSKIIEDIKGNLWLTINKNEAIRISFDDILETRNITNPIVRTFKVKDGVPDNIGRQYYIEDQLYIESANELYLFDPLSQKFVNNKKLLQKLGLDNIIAKVHSTDDNGNIWLIEYDGENRLEQLAAFAKKNGSYKVKALDEERIMDLRKNDMFPELEDSVIWYRGKKGVVIRHDLKQKLDKSILNSRAIITDIFWQNDSLLFGGYTTTITAQLPYKSNQLRFQYANPSFYDESKNKFQYILEGFDEDWSAWTDETKKDYTNIPAGDYSFKVRSKNIFNQVSSYDSYSFSILPPWYGSWWAYVLYGLGAIGIVALYSKWRSRELQRQNENLENLVAARTTEIRHKNELLNHQTEQLEQLNESKTRLYSNITHEFRTPLTVILGMAETLKTNVLNDRFEGAEKSLEMIRRNGKNLLQLVNEMLDLAKVESGSMELNLVQTDAIPFVKYLSESFHSLAQSKNINLTVYSEIESLEMDIDVNKMASIISNLLSNAIKFTGANGKIIVHLNKITTKESEFFSIKVQDNGLGLAEEDITHLFDRFYQVDNESSSKQEGTGIGLSLAKEFVELMNGTIGVESTLGKGSTFTAQIPVTHKAVKTLDTKITVEPPIKKTTNSKNTEPSVSEEASALPSVLIIEDNEDVAHYLKTCLKGKYQTMHAINGDLGIAKAFENIPDIIISDVMMPGKDGFEVCSILKTDERTDHIPIILLTAKVTTDDRLTGLAHGADAYLGKPFNEKELFIRLDQLVLLRKKFIDKIQKDGLNIFLDKKAEGPEIKFLQKVIQSINENMDNSAFGSSDLADKLHLSESQVYRKLKAITDKSTAVFIRSVRLQKAKELIQTTDKTISEIAYESGFNDPSWFSRAFKDEFGFPPSDLSK
ncbi:hybrid sensor histidine kinase/response regulator transcription factor [Maribacter polysaccharolyticus]|uniref:hybrid sensor histidine kinase/response regulator transcription factor n=1 Tax=Maribacter polysaccharolyticus TaxID=3020831 RepID=UPI00237F1B32|nr:hybrid sensor histidine kinase/response regulator transcription factor [Maribacter polysaccharolyticus]MDE3741327.1 hybrid sensor histidine kinase/response regulator transcription factor [Maribacter polysaccharolyticus]